MNFNTDKLVICHYPGGAGGKFILSVLAISENFAHQNRFFAQQKIKDKMDEEISYRISYEVMNYFNLKGKRYEFGCEEFCGFDTTQLPDSIEQAHDSFRNLCEQDKCYFALTNHGDHRPFDIFPNAKHLVIDNYGWILKRRDKKQIDHPTYPKNALHFDHASTLDQEFFANDIKKLCGELKIEIKNLKLVESLRQKFLSCIDTTW
jgi:hypothetical protein